MVDLPCDADGMCMVCKEVPLDDCVLLCCSCSSPWHMQCLNPPLKSVPVGDWSCPDCNMFSAPPISSSNAAANASAAVSSSTSIPGNDITSKILAITADTSLTDEEKARKRQELMGSQSAVAQNGKKGGADTSVQPAKGRRNETLEMLDENLNCIFCMNLAERPVTTPCGHNFCLKCFQRWVGQGKKNCGKCRATIPAAMANQPRINSALVMAIRLAKAATTSGGGGQGAPKHYHYIENEKRPDKCFTSERAVKTGKANACSGRIFVTIPPDHFGPISSEYDPTRGQGVLVGESWEDRMECRQWGAHFPHVAGIAGQSDHGAQSVALSGGYEDDEDHGEWFLYTGSGGRDLSGNKRTNKEQSFDQKFDKSNEALRVSCKRGYPVRVVRSHKEKRSSYAPEKGVRYDGVYRIEKCWRKKGIQGHKVCRYLFVRCDNEPAPWTTDEIGDRKRALPTIGELKEATDVYERKTEPAWEWKDESEKWGWVKNPPVSKKTGGGGGNGEKASRRKQLSTQQKLLKEFGCSLCRKVMQLPLSTPCGHNFCKPCLVGLYSGQQDMKERKAVGGRSLRVQKVIKRCPTCKADITDFISCPQVNRQMEDVIEKLKSSIAEDDDEEDPKAETNNAEKDSEDVEEAREEVIKDTDDESDSPAVIPPSNGHSQPSDSGHSNGLASHNLAEPAVNGQVMTVESAKDTSTLVHFTDTEIEVEVPKKAATKVPKNRGRKGVKASDEEASDVDSEFEVPVKRKRGRPPKGAALKSQKVV
ncbi:unnamed protein product [Calypogeia fissa]